MQLNNTDKPIKNKIAIVRLPFFIGLSLAAGILLGATLFGNGTTADKVTKNFTKFREIISYIDREYVDTVNINEITDYGIEQMLEKLDPHSVYIPAKEVELAKMPLEGDFDGIGVEFLIVKDTIQVVAPIIGGPSEQVGVRTGDKIVAVDGKNVAGIKITNRDVFTKLRGPRGTKVIVSVMRKGEPKPVDFTITRDKIPTHSVEVAYMIDPKTGYIKVSRFAQNTHQEFYDALKTLKGKGMKRLMIDLRDNPGGYMEQANRMANELLGDKKLIVYTKSKDGRYDSKAVADNKGDFETGACIVLMNEGSASASEILAGAIQDNDRGLIVGRRSFGKGLVQSPIPLSDGSELRLTISRYYTPSGRSIQKPYTSSKDYEMDFENRFEHGELFNKDSIKFNEKLKFKTLAGRTVYGGGGIMPDVFVPFDTTFSSKYLNALYIKNILREYALNYANENKAKLTSMGLPKFMETWTMSPAQEKDIIALAAKDGIEYNDTQYKRSRVTILNAMKAFVARSIWREEGSYRVIHEQDEIFQKALELWNEANNLTTTKK